MSNEGLTVLSLFDGMSCGAIALREAGIKVKQYFASEIDKAAIRQTQHNFPETIQLGSVVGVNVSELPHIDLLIGGSPCQGFSFAGKQLNFSDPRSVLFFEYVRILREIQKYNPDVKFLLENVCMRKEYENVISNSLGIFPTVINSSLLSAQNRVRLYWSNINTITVPNLFDETLHTDIPQPENKQIFVRDILEDNVEERFYLTKKEIEKLVRQRNYDIVEKESENMEFLLNVFGDLYDIPEFNGCQPTRFHGFDINNCMVDHKLYPPSDIERIPRDAIQRERLIIGFDNHDNRTVVISGATVSPQFGGGFRPIMSGKAPCLLATSSNCAACLIINGDDMVLRRLTPKECSRLQTIPEWYEWICSEAQIYRMLGNGWTVDVISHIFQYMSI